MNSGYPKLVGAVSLLLFIFRATTSSRFFIAATVTHLVCSTTPGAYTGSPLAAEAKRAIPDELAEDMQCEKKQVLLLQHQHELVSLEQPVYSEQEVTLFGDQIAAPDDTERWEQQREVGDLLKHLSPQERRVIELRYQLGQTRASSMEDIPLPYAEVSRQLGMTVGLVKATETCVLLKMRFWATRVPYRPTR